jgi:hypothetical protein
MAGGRGAIQASIEEEVYMCYVQLNNRGLSIEHCC